MRLLPLLLPLSLPLLSLASTEAESSNAAANADANAAPGTAGGGGLDPPGLAPLITRANVLLSAGQFSDAVRSYSDAIELSPKSYVLFFKRATAYLSLNRHAPALDDFDTVLQLTSGGFDKAYLMKAKIYTKEAKWGEARDMVKLYSNKVKGDRQAGDIVSQAFNMCVDRADEVVVVVVQRFGGRGCVEEGISRPKGQELGDLCRGIDKGIARSDLLCTTTTDARRLCTRHG